MADITTPRNLTELAIASMGGKQEDVKDFKDGKLTINFDDESKKIDLKKLEGTEFKGGNFELKGDKMKIQQGAEILGQQMLDKAKELKIDITKLPEFKNVNLDLNKDGKIDAKEVGAIVLAASMDTRIKQFGGVVTQFDNKLDKRDMEKLLDPKTAEMAKEIAKQLLADNGVEVTDPKNDKQFVQYVGEKGNVPRERC